MAGLIIILVALPLIYSSQTQNSFATPKKAFFQISVAALLVLFSLQAIVTPERLTSRKTPLDIVLLAWLAWEAISSACSLDRTESMRELVYSACLVAFFFIITRNVENQKQAFSLIGVIAALGVVEAAYGIPERLGIKLLYESRVKESLSQAEVLVARGSILGTFGNANQLASYLSLTCPLLFGAACICRGLRRAISIACLATVIACLILIGARGSWIAAAAGLAVFTIWYAKGRMREVMITVGIILLISALLLAVIMSVKPQIARELFGRLQGAAASLNYRFLAWRLSLRMIAQRPLLGGGPGMFKFLFLPTMAEYLSGFDPLSYWNLTEKMNEPHNEYLQTAVETGIPGLCFLILFCGGTVWFALKNVKKLAPSIAITSVMLISGLVAVMTDAFTSISFHVVPTRVAFWAMAATLLALLNAYGGGSPLDPKARTARGSGRRGRGSRGSPPKPKARPAPRPSRLAAVPYVALFLILACVAVSFSLRDIVFERYFKLGTNLTYMGRSPEAIPFYQKAIQAMPSSGQVKFYYGSALVKLGRYPEGVAVLEESKKNFQDVYLFKNLGLAYEKMGQPDKALEQYRRWREMGIASHDANNRIALIWLRQGKTREAEALFKETLRVRPWDWVAYSSLGSILLEDGRAEEAVQLLNPGPLWKIPESFTLRGVALLATGRLKEAEKMFLRTLSKNPHSIRALNNLGVLYLKTGRKDEAVTQWEEALRLDPDNSFAKDRLKAVWDGKV
jgi:tetratricopeptide (TPR) repeat protein/O-antigen ligase